MASFIITWENHMNRRLSALVVLICMMVTAPLQALAQTQPPAAPPTAPQWYGPGPWMWGDGFAWQYWWICPLMMLFMIVVVAAIFLLIRPGAGSSHHWGPPWRGSSHSALQILNERFARGEIQRDEYEDKRAAILSGAQH
jgi:putative membrane protein